jgi:transposase-like protein
MNNTGRPKGGKNRKWTKEEKLHIVLAYLNGNMGVNKFAKEAGVSKGMFWCWIDSYRRFGEQGLEPVERKYTGNHFAALHTSKSLSEEERLRLIVAKQEIEIERLKKGYFVKGDGPNKEFVITRDVSLKS